MTLPSQFGALSARHNWSGDAKILRDLARHFTHPADEATASYLNRLADRLTQLDTVTRMQCLCGATWWATAPVESSVPTGPGERWDDAVIKAAAEAAEHAWEWTPLSEMAEHAWPNAIRAAWPIIAAYLSISAVSDGT